MSHMRVYQQQIFSVLTKSFTTVTILHQKKSKMTVNIHEAKTHLSQLLTRVLMGEEVIIAKAGKPIARVTPYSDESRNRVPGRDRGMYTVPDDFDDPLPDVLPG